MLWQPTRPFEFTSSVIDKLKFKWLAVKPVSTLIFALPKLRKLLTARSINERIVETPFILGRLPPIGAKILDVGACESPVSLMLASLGYAVTAVDLRPYPFSHPNLRVVQGDITHMNLKAEYDAVICLSTLEHIGLPVYGGRKIAGGDRLAIRAMHKLLAPAGKLLLTTPAAPVGQLLPAWRVYSPPALTKLLKLFKSVRINYGIKSEPESWTVHSSLPANRYLTSAVPTAVALIEAIK